MPLSGFKVGPNSNDTCLRKKQAGGDLTHREEEGCHVKVEEVVGMMRPQAKECLGPRETREAGKDSFLEFPEGPWLC